MESRRNLARNDRSIWCNDRWGEEEEEALKISVNTIAHSDRRYFSLWLGAIWWPLGAWVEIPLRVEKNVDHSSLAASFPCFFFGMIFLVDAASIRTNILLFWAFGAIITCSVASCPDWASWSQCLRWTFSLTRLIAMAAYYFSSPYPNS